MSSIDGVKSPILLEEKPGNLKRVRFSPKPPEVRVFTPISELYHEETIPFNKANMAWICSPHGFSVLTKADIKAIGLYNKFVRKVIYDLEQEGKIDKDLFIVPQVEILNIHEDGVELSKENLSAENLQKKSILTDLETILSRPANIIAEQLSLIILHSGFASANFNNLALTKNHQIAFIGCKPFGLYEEKDGQLILNEEFLEHNGYIGLEKLQQNCQGSNLDQMSETIKAFLKERHLLEENCARCQKDLTEIKENPSSDSQ